MKRSLSLSAVLFSLLILSPELSRAETPVSTAVPASLAAPANPLASPRDYALHKMKAAGLSEAFIQRVLKAHDADTSERIVELNVLGFLHKADYSGHFSPRAMRKCAEFIRKYRTQLKLAKKRYGVEPEAIAALLWVETKHGKMTGSFPVSSVYFSLLQADHPFLIQSTTRTLSTKVPEVTAEHMTKVKERSQLKSDWALQELKALELIYQKNSKIFSAKKGRKASRELKGSFAGAFGYPQFIPSSYRQWARSSTQTSSKRPAANLFRMSDAIHSVASYLSSNGWKAGDLEAQRQALFHYNRAQGYVDVILKLAGCVSPGSTRQTVEAAGSTSNRVPAARNSCS